MTLIGNETLVRTKRGFVRAKNLQTEDRILTENGFREFKSEIVEYEGTIINLLVWGFPDLITSTQDDLFHSVKQNPCPDLGGLGICKPDNRCWSTCPDDHENKINFINVKDNQPLFLRKRGFLTMKISHTDNISYKNFKNINESFEQGWEFALLKYNDPTKFLNIENFINQSPDYFLSFMKGWHECMKETKLDKWNYFIIVNSKQAAYDAQFLFTYFGIPCAVEPYESKQFGKDKWAIIWCKDKKEFHYKSFKHSPYLYTQIKKWEKLNDQKISMIQIECPDANYVMAPFGIKLF